MQRIYLPNIIFSENLEISETELYHQITRVMRARVGQKYIFFDGATLQDYCYEITLIDKQKVVFLLLEIVPKHSDTNLELSLFQALPNKLEKLEYIIQKSCEVGYRALRFYQAERSQILILSENKKQRFQKIAIEAIEQCGGNIIPRLDFCNTYEIEPIKQGELALFCHTHCENAQALSSLDISQVQKLHIFIGPEGGFSEQETERFLESGFQKIFFGERILRTETVAPLVGFYLIQKTEA